MSAADEQPPPSASSHDFGSPSSSSGASIASSLLFRIQAGEADAWQRFSYLYGPIVEQWLSRAGVQPNDAADVAQEVFTAVAAHVADFERATANATFRGWLWRITQNKLRDFWRRSAHQPLGVGGSTMMLRMHEIDAPTDSLVEPPNEPGEEAALVARAIELVRQSVEPKTWQAFWRIVVDDQPTDIVAEELGMRLGAIHTAKSRVISRLRKELGDGFLDDPTILRSL